MSWIESHQELRNHPKTKRLARQLGISLPQAIGHLHCLWWWALDYAVTGDLSPYDSEDIADAAMWEGDPQEFIEALLTCGPGGRPGFLERGPDGRLRLHDWHDYAGRLINTRQASAEGGTWGNHKRWHLDRNIVALDCPYCTQSPPESGGESLPESGLRRVLSHHTVPNLTVPNLTVPNLDTHADNIAADESAAPVISLDSGQSERRNAQTDSVTPARVVDLWNEICGDVLPRVRVITTERRSKIRARAREPGRDESWWREYFARIRASPFLCGDGSRGWRADFDWAVRSETTIARVLEGRYDAPKPGTADSSTTGVQRLDPTPEQKAEWEREARELEALITGDPPEWWREKMA